MPGPRRPGVVGFVFLCSVVSSADAVERFASNGGADAGNDCSAPASPCATVAHALGQAGSGDTVRAARGFYPESLVISGTTTITVSGGWTEDFTARSAGDRSRLDGGRSHGLVEVSAGAGEVAVVTFEGWNMRRAAGSAIECVSSGDGSLNLTIADSELSRNGRGLSAASSGTSSLAVALTGSTFKANRLQVGGGSAVSAASSDASALAIDTDDCTFSRNRGGPGAGAIDLGSAD